MTGMKPTLANLKSVVRKSVEPEPYARFIIRPISIYFTWFLVRTPLSANMVTVIQELIGISGAILIATGSPPIMLAGVLFLQLGYILDCSDGEVARWKNQESINGVYLDLIGHTIVIPGYLFAVGFGVWQQTGRIEALICGFLAALFIVRSERNTMLSVVDDLISEAGESPEDFIESKNIDLSAPTQIVETGSAGAAGRRSLLQILFRYPDSMNVITGAVIIDLILIRTSSISSTYSLLYFVIVGYGSILTIGRIIQIYRVFNRGLVEKRFVQIYHIVSKLSKSKNHPN